LELVDWEVYDEENEKEEENYRRTRTPSYF
jgi:hypothetical protein